MVVGGDPCAARNFAACTLSWQRLTEPVFLPLRVVRNHGLLCPPSSPTNHRNRQGQCALNGCDRPIAVRHASRLRSFKLKKAAVQLFKATCPTMSSRQLPRLNSTISIPYLRPPISHHPRAVSPPSLCRFECARPPVQSSGRSAPLGVDRE